MRKLSRKECIQIGVLPIMVYVLLKDFLEEYNILNYIIMAGLMVNVLTMMYLANRIKKYKRIKLLIAGAFIFVGLIYYTYIIL